MSNFSLLAQDSSDNIIALATPPGRGAIAVLRISGKDAVKICNRVFRGKNLEKQASHTVHFGTIYDDKEEAIDEVLVSIFLAPKSYTGENVVEISSHGSPYLVKTLIEFFLGKGLRYAHPGEFTRRAFLNGKMDLAQAEAVADVIAAETAAAHKAAVIQMKGGFSGEIKRLREQLLNFAALVELELDFGEEDVTFADRTQLYGLTESLQNQISPLLNSFKMGNVIKNGVPVVIAGKPNAGKSTLLNALLNEEKAIVSEIPGTTRDFIEDEMVIKGISFRFIDTAGLRETTDKIEKIGVERAVQKMQNSALIIFLTDAAALESEENFAREYAEMTDLKNQHSAPFLFIANKIDMTKPDLRRFIEKNYPETLFLSAKEKIGMDFLTERMLALAEADKILRSDSVVTNARHYENLAEAQNALSKVKTALDNQLSGDLLSVHLRDALQKLGEITGEITNDEILGNIFSKFCIGK
jgi:tRNA modification GTPase